MTQICHLELVQLLSLKYFVNLSLFPMSFKKLSRIQMTFFKRISTHAWGNINLVNEVKVPIIPERKKENLIF